MLCSELDFDVKRDENIMDPSRRPFDEHLSDMQGRRQSPNFTQIYDDGVGFESIGYDITLPEKGVPRLQECDLVEVHNFDIPMSLAEWQGHEPSSFNITPVANKLVAVNDQRNSFGTSVVELPTSTKLLIGLSNFFIHQWWLLILLIAGAVFLYNRWKKTEAGW